MIRARARSTVDSASASGAEPPERCGHPSGTPSETGGVLRSTCAVTTRVPPNAASVYIRARPHYSRLRFAAVDGPVLG
jgi:hypothetical protein